MHTKREGISNCLALECAGFSLNLRQFIRSLIAAICVCVPLCAAGFAVAADANNDAELAKKLSNPVASLISVPIKLNWDTGIGSEGANRSTYLIQPVIPFSMNKDWNLITRTIIPLYINAQSATAGESKESGFGDIVQSFFFSPKAPTADGWIWGAGPVFLYPSATNSAVGREKWGAGPTAVFLKQNNGWTYGLLANHIWSVAGTDLRSDVSDTFIQPFLSFTTPKATTYGVNTESVYNWETNKWTVPVNLTVSQLMKFGEQPVSLQFGIRSYLERPAGAPDWGITLQATFLFPK